MHYQLTTFSIGLIIVNYWNLIFVIGSWSRILVTTVFWDQILCMYHAVFLHVADDGYFWSADAGGAETLVDKGNLLGKPLDLCDSKL